MEQEDGHHNAALPTELDAYYANLYGLTRDELRYILYPKEVYGPDFPAKPSGSSKKKKRSNTANTARNAYFWRRGINLNSTLRGKLR
jgi:hypothetical protein